MWGLISSKEWGWVKERGEVDHRGWLQWRKVNASAASWRDRVEHVEMVQNVIPSEEDEMSPATVTTTKAEGEDAVRGTLGERGGESSVLTVSFKLELRKVRVENAPVNEHNVRV